MAEKKDKYLFLGCMWPRDGAEEVVTMGIDSLKGKRYLVCPAVGDFPYELYLSKIGNLKGMQVRDLDNYDKVGEFTERVSQYGKFYISDKGEDGTCFMLNPKKEGSDKDYVFVLQKELEPYVYKTDAADVEEVKQAKPVRTF